MTDLGAQLGGDPSQLRQLGVDGADFILDRARRLCGGHGAEVITGGGTPYRTWCNSPGSLPGHEDAGTAEPLGEAGSLVGAGELGGGVVGAGELVGGVVGSVVGGVVGAVVGGVVGAVVGAGAGAAGAAGAGATALRVVAGTCGALAFESADAGLVWRSVVVGAGGSVDVSEPAC